MAVFRDRDSDAGPVDFGAQGFGKAVVAASALDGVLGAERTVLDFEGGSHVVIEAADHARTDFEFDFHGRCSSR